MIGGGSCRRAYAREVPTTDTPPAAAPASTVVPGPADDVWTVVVAGGTGTRFGSAKQYVRVHGATVLEHSIDAARTVGDVVAVVPAEDVDRVGDLLAGRGTAVVAGGASRAASVREGLAAVPASASVILVHDAARPAASAALFASVVAEVRAGAAAVVPVVAVPDSLRWVDGGVLDRDRVVAVQTPQGFDAAALRAAHAAAVADPRLDGTDDASTVEALGGAVHPVPGEPTNRKLTVPADEAALAAALGGAAVPGGAAVHGGVAVHDEESGK